ncbi:MAG: hypothetical protein JJT94_12020 [Bernardetiaceae bacterium]|nr:hypothetical protein [Bernardetiaceae bacterium]
MKNIFRSICTIWIFFSLISCDDPDWELSKMTAEVDGMFWEAVQVRAVLTDTLNRRTLTIVGADFRGNEMAISVIPEEGISLIDNATPNIILFRQMIGATSTSNACIPNASGRIHIVSLDLENKRVTMNFQARLCGPEGSKFVNMGVIDDLEFE